MDPRIILTLFSVAICYQTVWGLNPGLAAYEEASFTVPFDCDLCEPKFNRFVIHNETGDIYLGSSNRLSHLDSKFNEIKKPVSVRVNCGPDIDDEDCINRNQLLTIYYGSDILITCGSLQDGRCQVRNTSDISKSMMESEAVVPSGDHGTAYVIGPGSTSGEDVLYVSSSYDPARPGVPHVCKRLLGENVLLGISSGGSVPWAMVTTTNFIVNSVDGYLWDRFTYFLTNQYYDYDVEDFTRYRTILPKVKRVCHDSTDFDSYTDIVIQCRGKDGTPYNLIRDVHVGEAASNLAQSLGFDSAHEVLYAVFAKNVEMESAQPSNQSAICVFNLTEIAANFVKAIELCLESRGNENGIQYLGGRSCNVGLDDAKASETARAQECQALNYAHPNGNISSPLVSEAIMEWPNTLLSSITTTTERDHTIAFIGTATGDLLKIHIQNEAEIRVYETLSLGSPVLKDPAVDELNQHLIVLTEQKVFKLMVENCGYYTSCDECIGSTIDDGDPYCGWCTLTRKCTRWDDCTKPDKSTRWLSYNEAQCPGINLVSPFDRQPITQMQYINITVEQLPDLENGEEYECVFQLDDIVLASTVVKTDNDLQCKTPNTTALPSIADGTDYITMLLSIRSSETDVKFVDTNYTFFECGTHKRCTDCASSNWDCDWCVYGDVCTHDGATNCLNDTESTIIASKAHHRNNPSRRGPNECAHLENRTGKVLLAVGVDRHINITVKNLPDINLVPANSYECILYIEDKELKTTAERIHDDTVRCKETKFFYQAEIQELTASLTLYWTWEGTRRTIDDQFGFEVTLFKCEVLRSDCSRCVSNLTTRPELRCGWCNTSNICAVEDHPECGPIESWIREDPDGGTPRNCPRPVLSIWPSSGPIEGNTIIEINGTDLGRRFDNIKNVMVAGQECRHTEFEDLYEMSERLFCITTMAENDSGEEKNVFITVEGIDGSDQTNEGGTTFTYKNPQIRDFSPEFGPAAGGTTVNITGSYLLTGRNISIQIGNATCLFDRSLTNEEELLCSTSESYEDNIDPITMIFDGAERRSEKNYRYRGDPDIDNVQPRQAFKSGGRVLSVTGINLDVVQSPQILVGLQGKKYTEACKVVHANGTMMSCPSPAVEVTTMTRRRREAAESATLGFIMDGVSSLRTWSQNDNRSFAFEYYQDPNYFSFEENMSVEDRELQIEGERLNLASDEKDVTVYIGDLKCSVTSLGLKILSCILPDQLRNATSNFTLLVTIVQGNLHFTNIGSVIFQAVPSPPQPEPELPLGIIVGVAAVALFLLIIIIVLTVVFRAREKHAVEQTTKLLNEMEKLEDSMAGRIRDAFAQLQLDLQDLTSDLEGTGMPFVTQAQYVNNMLYAGINSKPSTADPINMDDRKDRAMAEFCKLLQNKTFLLAFIQVLDEPRSVPAPVIRERTKFACFLTTLMIREDKLPYLTDVMLTLLKKYIDEAVEDDKAFQLCQRTETVVERLLTNWVSICLFKYLKDRAAFPLFVLYRAILLQAEKGPVDIVTGKAYYSLSEHNVLTLDNKEYQAMTLNAVVNEGDGESKEIKVTNLDAISQVKEKILDVIYRNKSYSERPDIALVDLEWRQGQAGRLILRDDDQTTVKDDEFKEINTLEHYKVPDGAKVALVVKQNVPNGAIDPHVLRAGIFVREEEQKDKGELKDEKEEQLENPTVSVFHRRARARYTVYELDKVPLDDPQRHLKVYHLEKEEEEGDFQRSNRKSRKSRSAARRRLSKRVSFVIKHRESSIRKIHYPQLLTAKGATQQFVDQMFGAVLDKDCIPKPIKYMFDFLEIEARRHDITDKEILHKWKSNCLPLRFWVTIINNPQYIFDIRESRSVTSSLNVVGQAFFDAFNRTNYKHTKETGFNKLLYHKELEDFQERVDTYYAAIKELPQVDNAEIDEELDMISKEFTSEFNRLSTLTQLYNFVQMNNDKLIDALEEDETCRTEQFAYKLESITAILEGETV